MLSFTLSFTSSTAQKNFLPRKQTPREENVCAREIQRTIYFINSILCEEVKLLPSAVLADNLQK